MIVKDDYDRRLREFLESKRKYESLSIAKKGIMRLRGSYDGVKYVPNRPDFDEIGKRKCIMDLIYLLYELLNLVWIL